MIDLVLATVNIRNNFICMNFDVFNSKLGRVKHAEIFNFFLKMWMASLGSVCLIDEENKRTVDILLSL